MFESTPRRMIRREGGSSRGRMPMGVRPRDNGRMTLSTVERPALGDWHVDGVRVWWDRIRAWDESHERWSDLGISVLLLVVCLAFPRGFGVHRLDSAIFQVALIVPLIWRRREPTVVFLAIAAVAFAQWLTVVPLPADSALLIALFTLAVYATTSRALLGAAVLMVGVVMASVRWVPAGDLTKSLVFLTGLVIAALFVGLALRTWHSYMDSLVERTKRLEFERDQQARLAAAAERSRIAREMHDVVAHNVSIMVTLADGALATADAHPTRAKEAMADVSATGRLALTDMRQLLGVLRTENVAAEREPQPQLSGLPKLIQGVRSTGLDIEFSELGTPFNVPPGLELTIFRIVQESLTNILKHAQRASTAQVTLSFERPFVIVSVRDNGNVVGSISEGHGLSGMRERAALSRGTLTAGPQQDGGWEVTGRVRADL
jgi:signal transduction histidine kinase